MHPSDSESIEPSGSDRDAVARFAAAHEQIKILRAELQGVRPSIWPAVLALQLAVVLLLVAIGVALMPYFVTTFPQVVAEVAAFAAVPLAFLAYSTLGRATSQFRSRQRHQRLLVKTTVVAEAADQAWATALHLMKADPARAPSGTPEVSR